MDKDELIRQLKNEGFPIVYEWTDDPNTVYEEHTHQGKVSFYVIKGMVSFSGGIDNVISIGERIDVPPGIKHSAIIGPEGCTYIVGQEFEGDA
jgi:quercetin dioxygenase-like cupin family protein